MAIAKTGVLITGDASGAAKATMLTRKEIARLINGSLRGGIRQNVKAATSRSSFS